MREKGQNEDGDPPVAERSRESAAHCSVVSFTNRARYFLKERAIGHGTSRNRILRVLVLDWAQPYHEDAKTQRTEALSFQHADLDNHSRVWKRHFRQGFE